MKFFLIYGLSFLLGTLLLWFIWSQLMATPAATPEQEVGEAPAEELATTTEATEEPVATTTVDTTMPEQRIEGVFLSLQEMETEWRTAHTYLLLDDGTEIFRIDLRPLLGNTVRDVPEKLGVARGDRIEVVGRFASDGTFSVQSIAPVSPSASE